MPRDSRSPVNGPGARDRRYVVPLVPEFEELRDHEEAQRDVDRRQMGDPDHTFPQGPRPKARYSIASESRSPSVFALKNIIPSLRRTGVRPSL